jgi:hypothetical protein
MPQKRRKKARDAEIGDMVRFKDGTWVRIDHVEYYDTKTAGNPRVRLHGGCRSQRFRDASPIFFLTVPAVPSPVLPRCASLAEWKLRAYRARIGKYRHGGWICHCGRIVPLYEKCCIGVSAEDYQPI